MAHRVEPRILLLTALALTLTVPLQWAIIGSALLSVLSYAASAPSMATAMVFEKDQTGWRYLVDTRGRLESGQSTIMA